MFRFKIPLSGPSVLVLAFLLLLVLAFFHDTAFTIGNAALSEPQGPLEALLLRRECCFNATMLPFNTAACVHVARKLSHALTPPVVVRSFCFYDFCSSSCLYPFSIARLPSSQIMTLLPGTIIIAITTNRITALREAAKRARQLR